MKLAALAAGTFLALAVSGPTVLNTQPVTRDMSDIVAPAWMPLPSKPFISSIEYAGEAGVEAAFGTIIYDLPTDGASEINWLTAQLKAAGYSIDDRTSAIDNFAGADAVISAKNFSSGRRVNLVNTIRMDGATLRVTFEDPSADTYVSLL